MKDHVSHAFFVKAADFFSKPATSYGLKPSYKRKDPVRNSGSGGRSKAPAGDRNH